MKKQAKLAVAAAAAAALMMANHGFAAAITPGDLVVYEVGNGSNTLASTSAQVQLLEYTTGGTLVQTIAMPTVTAVVNGVTENALWASGTSTSLTSTATEGQLTISPNGQYIALTGYDDQARAQTTETSSSSTTPRTIGIVNVSTGAVDTSTTLTNAFTSTGSNAPIRAAVTTDGQNIYTVGNGANSSQKGIFYSTLGSSTGTQVATDTDFYITAYNNQLYVVDDNIANNGVFSVPNSGGNLPTSLVSTDPNTSNYKFIAFADRLTVPGTTSNPESFVMTNLGTAAQNQGANPDTLYLIDSVDQTIEKFTGPGTYAAGNGLPASLNGPGYSLTGYVSMPGGVTPLALTAEYVTDAGGNPEVELFVTTASGIYELTDDSGFDGTLSGTPSEIVTLTDAHYQFRGITAVQAAAVPEPATLSLVLLGGIPLLARRRRRQ